MLDTTDSHARPADPLDGPTHPGRAAGWGPFARHYLEMVVTMIIGMMVLHPLWQLAFRGLGDPGALHHPTVMALVMATDMSLGMGAWMRYRGHGWRSIAEMSSTMYVPFAVLLPAVWAGVIDGGTMIAAGHLLMLPAMLGLMLWRREEYGHGCHTRTDTSTGASAAAIETPGPVTLR
jgi:hypothetical protein